ncbi:S66 peptidase family protein [Clostridium sp.]|uniref:S66 family peptidase n=1 Tax=Clostridium sp. TaxID=1506 RepID=UPI00260ACD61|nr:S66 peptidase family protein [Clostridium sp.]
MNSFLKKGDSIGIIACSNGLSRKNKDILNIVKENLKSIEIECLEAETLYAKKYNLFSGSGKERADSLKKLFLNEEVKMIFDVSGGDLANEVLDYIDFEVIKNNPKAFCGYSDLTVLLNAIYSQCNIPTYNYQLRNLAGNYKEEQLKNFKGTFIDGKKDLFNITYEWINGKSLEGVVVGGNIRCFLKLAGTKYMPSFKDKILFLESFSGNVAKMITYLTQYKNLGVFDEIKGIILGEFTEMQKKEYSPNIIELVKSFVEHRNIPIIKTENLGHSQDAMCLPVGEYVSFK